MIIPLHWRSIAPGLWLDPLDGTLHVDTEAVCKHLGIEPTPEAQDEVAEGVMLACADQGVPYLGHRWHDAGEEDRINDN